MGKNIVKLNEELTSEITVFCKNRLEQYIYCKSRRRQALAVIVSAFLQSSCDGPSDWRKSRM
jgi:hypothetical protein